MKIRDLQCFMEMARLGMSAAPPMIFESPVLDQEIEIES
jgi:hypothetical protein